ncbi:SAP domain-containing protein [Paenibacillus thailandensis]|uniref:SAP domain-containing protein n=1 Tax=Paenibacillus thailandensis TaxID=393250 RepID=A0ABW5R4B7_9BACL
MVLSIATDVIEHINSERFKELLRKHNLQVSGTKNELVNRIKQAINGELGEVSLTVEALDQFLAEEISHGKNRMLFITSFPSTAKRLLQDRRSVLTNLSVHGLPLNNFNHLRSIERPEETTLVYMNINSIHDVVRSLSFCFAKTTIIEGLVDEEGEELPPRYETDYIWADIEPESETITIKIRPKANHFENVAKTKELYEEISTKLREIFSLPPRLIEETKHTLYKIFRDLTRTAEEPFRARVEPLKDEIRKFATQSAEKIGLPSPEQPVDLPYRLFRLLERALIQQEFDLYKAYFEGKRGVIDRISFSDPTGAHVNARSGQVNDGIAMADIYFDTRDTIETLRKFDKLWVTWFYIEDHQKPPVKIETKFEVFKEHFTIHFLYAYTTKEVEDHVLSNFKYYESLPD